MDEKRLAELEALRDASGITAPVEHTEYGGEHVWIEGGLSEAATAGEYFAISANRPAGEYIKALLNNADWFISQLRPLCTVVDAVEVLIKYGVPERDDDPEYNSDCYYCHGGWATEEDGVMRIQHNEGCKWGMLRDALNALKNEEGQ